MPIISASFSPSTGARLQVEITPGRQDLLRRRQAHQPIPQPITVTALLDSGAESTCIDPGIATRLNLPLCGAGFTLAPGVATGPSSLGGALPQFSYDAGLVILHPTNQSKLNLVFPDLTVDTLPLLAFGIEAVIGRDVLAACILVINGPAGTATLAY
jgi:hypothetical protein